ncbi:MAG: RNA-guided endonuclease TnpB family protein [Candidatus Humimicrobiia bacterium]
MKLTYKFRLYPNKDQEKKLLHTLDRCRFVYNKLLEELNKQEKIDRKILQHLIVELKEKYKELKEVYSKVLQYEHYRLFSNLRALSRLKKNGKKVGKLRFKGKGWFKTFTYNQSGFKLIETNKRLDLLHLSKIGNIKIRIHRAVKGKIKQIAIKHCSSKKWYACITVEIKEKITKSSNSKKVGIDLGLIDFIYDSDGNKIKHPKILDKSLKKLTKEQRRLSRKKKKSRNRKKQRIKVARVYERTVNQRNDFLHKLSRCYVKGYGFIALEKLNIKGMVKNRYLSKSIIDASWSKFIQLIQYKAENAGVDIIKIDPKNTTINCSNCGSKVYKKLYNRIHKCKCGLEIERDYNSAINILNIGQGLSKFTPVKIEPLRELTEVPVSSVVEAGSPLR